MARLSGKGAVIVGADEIGVGVATRFVREGAQVVLVRIGDEAPELGPDATWSLVDVPSLERRADAVAVVGRAVEQLGGVHVLVNNLLGPVEPTPIELKTESTFAAAMSGAAAALWTMQAAHPYFREQGWGRIVNFGSRYGERMNWWAADHAAAAWALRSLTRSAASEWSADGIRVNMLEAAADTSEFRAFREASPETVDALLAQVAMRRRGNLVEDIGGAATFLACDEANFINGHIVYADGGQHLSVAAHDLTLCPQALVP